jgi:hypothetical protein
MSELALAPLSVRWEMLPLRTKLPFIWEQFARASSAAEPEPDCRRHVSRLPARCRAILEHQGHHYGVYAGDVSRKGVGFFSPLKLVLGERASLEFPGGWNLQVAITRCQKMADGCFACGAVYDRASHSFE